MRKLWSCVLLCTLVLTCVLALPTVGLAEDSLHTQVTVSKSSLPGPGTVALKLTITNNGDPVSNVVLEYPSTGQEYSLGSIASGDSQVHENPRWDITESMLNTPLRFQISWTSEDGSTHTGMTPPVTIEQGQSSLNVEAQATVSSTHVQEGDKVTFTFTFDNKGDVDVTDAYLVAEPLNGGDRLGDDFSLEPGETNTKTWSPTINEELTVRPVYTYTVNGEEHKLECDPITVRVGDGSEPEAGSLAIEATPNTQTVGPGGTVEFSIGVSNTGTADVANVRVTCSNGQSAVLPQQALAPGASATATQTIQIDQSQSFTFTATGTSNGEPITAESTPAQISVDPNLAEPTPEPSLDAASIVEIGVSVVTQLQRPGDIPVEITVRNLSQEQLSNIVVSAEVTPIVGAGTGSDAARSSSALPTETVAGAAAAAEPEIVTLGTLNTLGAGQQDVIDTTLTVAQTSNFIFRVSTEMPDGTLITSETSSARITVEGGGSLISGLENWQLIAIIAAAAVAIAVIILVLHNRKKKKTAAKPAPAAAAAAAAPRSSTPHASRVPRNTTTVSQNTATRPSTTGTVSQRTSTRSATSVDMAAQRYRDTTDFTDKAIATNAAASRSNRAAAPAKSPTRKTSARSKSSNAGSRYGDRNRF